MARVSVPFTEGHYCGNMERPNTELADNSLVISRNRNYNNNHLCNTKNWKEHYNENPFIQNEISKVLI